MVYFAEPTVLSVVLGLVVIALGELLRLWSVAIAGSETRTTGPVGGTHLITTGPFAYVRNPLYVGNMLIYTGVGMMSNALFPWLMIVALGYFFFQYFLIVSLEEEHLSTAFGETFRLYFAAVPRFIPRLTPYAGGASGQPELNWSKGLRSERRTLQAVALIVCVLGIRWLVWS